MVGGLSRVALGLACRPSLACSVVRSLLLLVGLRFMKTGRTRVSGWVCDGVCGTKTGATWCCPSRGACGFRPTAACATVHRPQDGSVTRAEAKRGARLGFVLFVAWCHTTYSCVENEKSGLFQTVCSPPLLQSCTDYGQGHLPRPAPSVHANVFAGLARNALSYSTPN